MKKFSRLMIIFVFFIMLVGFTYSSFNGFYYFNDSSIWWKSNEVSVVDVYDGAYSWTGTAPKSKVVFLNSTDFKMTINGIARDYKTGNIMFSTSAHTMANFRALLSNTIIYNSRFYVRG